MSQRRDTGSRSTPARTSFILDHASTRGSADLAPTQVSPFPSRPHRIALLDATARGVPTGPADSRHASASVHAGGQVAAGL